MHFNRSLLRLVSALTLCASSCLLGCKASGPIVVEGLLVSQTGVPFEGEVTGHRLCDWGWDDVAWAYAKEGHFRFEVNDPGLWRFSIRSMGAVSGSASTGPLELAAGEHMTDMRLQLAGAGVIRGQVVDASGRPAMGVELVVLTEISARKQGDRIGLWGEEYADERDGRGLSWSVASTDSNGRFEVTGLTDDRFVIRAKGSGENRYPFELTEKALAADGAEQTLVFERNHVVVQLADDGKVLTDEQLSEDRWNRMQLTGEFPDTGGERTLLFHGRQPLLIPRVGPTTAMDFVGSHALGDGVYVLDELKPGPYELLAVGGGAPLQHKAIEIQQHSGRIDVELETPTAIPTGQLTVLVRAPSGEPLNEDVKIKVLDPATGVPLVTWRLRAGEEADKIELPLGEYVVEASSVAFRDFHHGTLLTRRKFGAARQRIQITAEELQAMDLTLEAPSLLRLTREGQPSAADFEAARHARQTTSYGEPIELAEIAGRVQIWLQREGEFAETVDFYVPRGAATGNWGARQTPTVTLDEPLTSEALPSGRFTMTAMSMSGQSTSQVIELIPGETLDVALAFD